MTKGEQIFQQTMAFSRWQPAAWLRISGEDAGSFLQGQFSNDLRGLESDAAVYGLWLNHKGRVLADSFILRGAGHSEFWVGSYESSSLVIRERLEAYVIADDVVIEDQTEAWSAIALIGPRARERATVLKESLAGAFVFRGRRMKDESWECVFPAAEVERLAALLTDSAECSAAELERWRIDAGVPAVPRDIGPADLPNEGGLEADAISYTKGCYLGQEVMARLKSMGQVRRRLMRVTGRGAAPALPAPLYQGERKIGELRSAVDAAEGFVGLALMTLLNLAADAPLGLAPGAETVILAEHRP